MPSPTDTVQAVYAAFGSGDIPRLLGLLDDAVEWRFLGHIDAPFVGRFVGKAQVQQWFAHVAENEDIQAFEPREFLAGPDHVTVLGWERTQAVPGGGTFESDWVHVWKLRDGRITQMTGLYDTAASDAARRSRQARPA